MLSAARAVRATVAARGASAAVRLPHAAAGGCRVSPAVPARYASSKPVYGAPFTNSVYLRAAATSPAPGADAFRLTLRIPDMPAGELELLGRDSLAAVAARVGELTGAKNVGWFLSGARLAPAEAGRTTVHETLGHTLEVTLDGVRYSVNEGNALNALGKASKRSLARTYAYVATGGFLVLAGTVWFWRKVIPRGHQRV